MGSFKDYINKKNNTTATNNSSSSSSFMQYHEKRNKEREDEEKKKQEELKKQQELQEKQREEELKKQQETQNNNVPKPTYQMLLESNKAVSNQPLTNMDSSNLKELGTAVKASDDIYSDNTSERVAANIRYALDRAKQGIKNVPKEVGDWLINTTASDYEKYAGEGSLADKISKKINDEEEYEKEKTEREERLQLDKFKKHAKAQNADYNAEQLYQQTLPTATQTIGNVGEQVGRILPVAGLSVINPALGDAVMFASSAGRESTQLIDNGENFRKSVTTGNLKGIIEVGTEKVTGGIKFRGKGALDDIVGNAISNGTKTKVGNFLATKGYQIAGEIGEEYISNIAGYGIDKLILNKNTSLSDAWQDTKETTKTTFLTTLALNLIGLGGANYSNNTSVNQQLINEYENITNTKLSEQEKNNLFNEVEEIKQSIENNQQTLYNNNESESGINGDIERYIDEGRNRLYEKQENSQSREYSWEEYNKWEQSIKPIEEQSLTESERQLIVNAKSENNKDVVLYDENSNDNTYSGGASQKVKNKIVISKQKAEVFGLRKMIDHETAESDILHNEIANDILTPIIETIESDTKFTKQKDLFWEGQEGNIPSNKLIAKDILCDRFSELKNGEKLDYKNILSNATNLTIDMALKNYYKQVYGKELGETSSFYVENNQNIAPSMTNNTLPVGEYTKKQNRANQSLLDWLDYKHIDYEIDENNNIISIENKNAIEQYYKEINENTVDLPMFANEIIEKETNTEKYSKYKQSIIKSRESEINNLIAYKNKTIKNIENKIAEKQRILASKKNKDSKVANNLKMQIENLTRQKNSIENQYVARIERKEKVLKNAKINQETKKTMHLSREEVRDRLFKEMQISDKDLSVGKDIKNLNYQFTDPVRVNEKVFGKEIGDKINNATINKTKHNTAEKIRWQNKERQEIKNLGITARTEESAAVQKYGEKQWVNEKGEIVSYGDFELSNEFPNVEAQNKIKKAAQVLRNKYDTYIDQINEVLIGLGYNPVPKRNDYMRHFHELGDMFSRSGVPFNLNDMSAEDLPTDINGLTEFNKPGKNWFANSQIRYGNKTTYDAITGIDGYLEGAGNLIFHTEDIQNYRALSEAIRNQFGEKGFENLEGLTESETEQRIKDIQDNKLSRYVAWLDEQANSLAGKKGAIDRGFERFLGRKGYTLLNTVKKQVGSNMTGFNVRSGLTNLISSTIASAKTNKIALAKGTWSTIKNMFHNDGFVEKNDFLTSRFGSDSLSEKTWQKISNAGQIFMAGSDYFTSNLIARSKYFEGLQMGMVEKEALNYSNDFSSKVMGDRSQGAMPEAFNSKTLGLFTQFQLEVNNQWQYMIHDTKMEYQENLKDKGGLKAGATVLFQMGQLAAYSYFFNELFEKLTGSRAAFDPIEMFKTLFGLDDEDDEKTFGERVEETKDMLLGNLPIVSILNGGRIPISEALPITELLTGKDEYGNKKSRIATLKEVAPYWVLPTGYSQAKKTFQGLSTVVNNGDYKTNSKGEKELRYPVENKNVGTYLKAGLFGKYALPTAQDYVDSDFKSLSAKQTKTYENSKISYADYLEYLGQNLKSNEDKINYINNTKWTTEQKWGIYTNDILSDNKREDGGSQLSDAEYMVKNGTSKLDYINSYNKAQMNDIKLPAKDEYKDMKKSGLSLKTYIDYSVKVKQETASQRKSGIIKENGDLKNVDKIGILLAGNYSDKEKTALYEQYILSSSDEKYSIVKECFTTTGLNITNYLKYKSQEFSGDKKDDGTVKGKTISGSKKNKVWNYIENMDITYTQKLILYGLEYTPTDKEQTQIFNYVESLPNKTNNEKLEILSHFEGFTIYKNGNVEW